MPGPLFSAVVRLPVWLDGRDVRNLDSATRDARTEELLAQVAGLDEPDERQSLLDEVVLLNGPVAHAIVGRYAARGVEVDDLVQVAYLGLVKASQGYRPGAGSGFLAYAVPTISGEIKRYFRDHGWTVRPPRRVQEVRSAALVAAAEMVQRYGAVPSTEKVAAAVGATTGEVTEARLADGCFNALSLDSPSSGGSGVSLSEQLADDSDPYEHVETMETLRPVLRALSDRDREILLRRFVRGQTQQQIGEEIGVSQMQVSRLLTRILRSLREELDGADEGRPNVSEAPRETV